MDKIFFSGNVGKDPEVSEKNGTRMAKFTVAVNRKKNGEKDVDWRNVTVFGKTVDFVEKFVTKGRTVLIEGRPSAHAYKNKLEELMATIDVVADTVELVGGKNESGATPAGKSDPVDIGEEAMPF